MTPQWDRVTRWSECTGFPRKEPFVEKKEDLSALHFFIRVTWRPLCPQQHLKD